MVKKWFLAQKWVFRAIIAESLKNDSFWPQNHFFTIIPPNPVYIYPNICSSENFTKKLFCPLGPPLGYLGSLSQDPLHRIFSKCVFLNLLSSQGRPCLKMLWDPPKNWKNVQGALCYWPGQEYLSPSISLTYYLYVFISLHSLLHKLDPFSSRTLESLVLINCVV